MGRPKKMSISELQQASGKTNSEKTVAEVIGKSTNVEIPKSESLAVVKETKSEQYVAHGALAPDQNKTITQLLGKYRKNSYASYANIQEYSKYINNLPLAELHKHSIEVANVIPIQDKVKLIKNLEGEYNAYQAKSFGRFVPPQNLSTEAAAKVSEILSRKIKGTA